MSRKNRRRPTKVERKMDSVYLPALKKLVDQIYQRAFDLKWSWPDLAEESGLSLATVRKLGLYETKYPQLRTVELLALALGGRIAFDYKKVVRLQRKTWTPKLFGVKLRIKPKTRRKAA